jgi:chorismate-pyruvate lyase
VKTSLTDERMSRVQDTSAQPPAVELSELVGLFYEDAARSSLGEFHAIEDAARIPQPQRELLNHESHMTVTVEAFHQGPVDVRVHRTRFGIDPGDNFRGPEIDRARWYAREITLHRHRDGVPVQYGIVRLNIALLAPAVWQEIRSQRIPLGRVLIEHRVLREVELCGLWQITAGPALADQLSLQPGACVYGRTARIHCDSQPAIELLEIVTS